MPAAAIASAESATTSADAAVRVGAATEFVGVAAFGDVQRSVTIAAPAPADNSSPPTRNAVPCVIEMGEGCVMADLVDTLSLFTAQAVESARHSDPPAHSN